MDFLSLEIFEWWSLNIMAMSFGLIYDISNGVDLIMMAIIFNPAASWFTFTHSWLIEAHSFFSLPYCRIF